MKMPTKEPKFGKERTLDFTLAGMNYRVAPLAQKEMAGNTPIRLSLRREPENQHDENAIAVYLETYRKGMHVGYVPRGVAETLAPLMDGKQVEIESVWLTSVDPTGHTGTILLTLRKKLSQGT